MKVICWSMGAAFGFRGERHAKAWAWLNSQEADVALLQEMVPRVEATQPWGSVIFAGKYQNWGSGVVVRKPGYEAWPIDSGSQPWLRCVRGAVAVARPSTGTGVCFASVHSDASSFESIRKRYTKTYADLPDREGIARCSDREMWEIEPIAHELGRLFRGQRFVMGGDLNSSLLFDGKDASNSRLFANLDVQGFRDLRTRHSRDEVQTFFKANTKPFQLDHTFADSQTELTVERWEVLTHVATDLGLSDHAPIQIDFASTM